MSRIEKQLMKINGDDVEIEEPQSRIEKQLAYILGADIVLEEPQSRIEELVQQIIDNGGGGGGGGSSDFSYINVTFINSATDNSSYSVKSVQTDDEYGVFFDMIASIGNTEQTIPLLAYKGRIVLFEDNFESIDYENGAPVVTGDVVFDEDQWSFTITGECSITLKSQGIN